MNIDEAIAKPATKSLKKATILPSLMNEGKIDKYSFKTLSNPSIDVAVFIHQNILPTTNVVRIIVINNSIYFILIFKLAHNRPNKTNQVHNSNTRDHELNKLDLNTNSIQNSSRNSLNRFPVIQDTKTH